MLGITQVVEAAAILVLEALVTVIIVAVQVVMVFHLAEIPTLVAEVVAVIGLDMLEALVAVEQVTAGQVLEDSLNLTQHIMDLAEDLEEVRAVQTTVATVIAV
jgi:hypothetical protein